jgi:N-dimethylarginine dimethylaminohydrolase
LNLLSLDERTVVVDRKQDKLVEQLSKHGIMSIPMRLRHARTLGGSFHCVTLDTHRGE